MNNNKKFTSILFVYLSIMTIITGSILYLLVMSFIDGTISTADVVYRAVLIEIFMSAASFFLFAVALVLNIIKKYHKKITQFAIRLFTLFLLLDMIIYILVFRTIFNDIILYIASIYIALAAASYIMDVIAAKLFSNG